jgi:predicted Zn-ribbon and HTH transcriptional regulator
VRSRLFILFSALSLLLCVATVAWWVRSYFAVDSVTRTNWRIEKLDLSYDLQAVRSSRGGLAITIYMRKAKLSGDGDGESAAISPGVRYHAEHYPAPGYPLLLSPSQYQMSFCGFYYRDYEDVRPQRPYEERSVDVVVPHAAACGALLVCPVLWYRRYSRTRRRRPRPGHCRSCGYDLTANASGRCPECGAAVDAAPVAAEPRA